MPRRAKDSKERSRHRQTAKQQRDSGLAADASRNAGPTEHRQAATSDAPVGPDPNAHR